jgi:hypothetical protein
MWHYEKDSQQFGPVSVDEIEQLFRSGSINGSTPVWREGMSEWQPLIETDLVAMWNNLRAHSLPPKLPASPPPLYSVGPRVRSEILKRLFDWWARLLKIAVCSFLFYLLFFILGIPKVGLIAPVGLQVFFTVLTLGFCILSLIANGVLFYPLLYKFWQIVQDGFASTTPGMAIGFLFIPYFNYYWFYRAIYGLSKDFNRYIDAHFSQLTENSVRRAHPTLALASILPMYAIFLFSFIPLIIFHFISLTSVVNSSAPSTRLIDTFFIFLAILCISFWVLNLLTLVDFYRTGQSILKAEEFA